MSTVTQAIKKQTPFICTAIVLIVLFLSVYMTTHSAIAACTSDADCGSRACRLPDGVCVARLESGIPGVGVSGAQGQGVPSVPTYINYLYIFVLSFVGIAGFISLVIWGTVWVGSAVVDQKARAMEGIKNTLIGIGIALTAFIILYTINPDLTIIKTPETAIIDTTNKAETLIKNKKGSCAFCSSGQECVFSGPYTFAGCALPDERCPLLNNASDPKSACTFNTKYCAWCVTVKAGFFSSAQGICVPEGFTNCPNTLNPL